MDSARGSRELLPYLTRYPLSLKAELADLPFADFCFEGWGPKGFMGIGIERKTLHDMLRCIDDARYTGYQRIGMAQMYQVCFLLIEGSWRPHSENGFLMQQYPNGSWGESKTPMRTMYNKLRRYLFSVSLSGVHVLYTRDMQHTAWDIHEAYQYFQKKWHTHTSLLEMQKLNIPTLHDHPSLVRRWANDLTGIGVVHSEAAEQLFKKPILLANSDERDWLRIPGLGVRSAQKIVREIWGVQDG